MKGAATGAARRPRAVLGRPLAALSAHPHLAAAFLIAAVLLLWNWPLLIGHQMGQSYTLWNEFPWKGVKPAGLEVSPRAGEGDAAVLYHPVTALSHDHVAGGELPLWNPYVYAGAPLLGDMQSAPGYPLTWLALIFPADAAWGWIALLKLFTAGMGAYLLGRRLRLSWGAAVLAGLVYVLSAPLIVWLQWPLGTVFSLFPWLLWATDRVLRTPGPGSAAGLSAVVGLSLLAGHGETALLSSTAAAVYLAVVLIRERPRRWPSAVGAWLGAHVLGVGLAAVALLPFLEAYRHSITVAVHGDNAAARLPAKALVNYLMPNFFGDDRSGALGGIDYLHTAAYFGVAALMLAAVGLWRRQREPVMVAVAAAALFALMVAFGVPPVSLVMSIVPPYSNGNNLRVLYVPALAAGLLAGTGMDALARRPMLLRAALVPAAALAGLALLMWGVIAVAGGLEGPADQRLGSAVRLAVVLALGTGCLLAVGRLRRHAAVALVLVVAALDLAYLQDRNTILPADEAYPPASPAISYLERQRGPFRFAAIRPGIFARAVLPGSTGVLHGLENIGGYELPQSERWADFSYFVLGHRGLTRELILTTPAPRGSALTAQRMMNVRYYVTAPDAPPLDRSLAVAYRGPDAVVYRDPRALPRAYVVPRVRRAGYDEALSALVRGGLDPRREALVPPDAPEPGPDAGGSLRPARARALDSQHVRVEVPTGPGGWLVVANAYSPQWEATVDGRPAELQPTNFAAMGLPMEAGAHTVELRLDRTSFWSGLAISALSLVVVLLLAGPFARLQRRSAG
jgi:hypothetical protein